MAIPHHDSVTFATDYANHRGHMRGYRPPSRYHAEFLDFIKSKGSTFFLFFQEQYSWQNFNQLHPSEFSDVFVHLENMFISKKQQNELSPINTNRDMAYYSLLNSTPDISRIADKPPCKKKYATWLEELQVDVNQWLKEINYLITQPK